MTYNYYVEPLLSFTYICRQITLWSYIGEACFTFYDIQTIHIPTDVNIYLGNGYEYTMYIFNILCKGATTEPVYTWKLYINVKILIC